jgi:hypothetical protein
MVRAASNSGGARTGTVTIAGQAYTVKQSGSLGPDACGALDITSQVSVTRSSLTPVPFSTLYSQSITVRNGTGSTIPGPVYVVLLGEPTHVAFPDNSFLLSGGPTTSCFSTPGDYLLPISGGLAPGQTVGAALAWTTQSRLASINYSIKVLSGTPSH